MLVGRLLVGGTEGNRRLTATIAAVLLVLLAAEGATLLAIRPLLSVHIFLGMLLIPPVALKLASTGYRFARYYLRDAAYRRERPPAVLMRMLVAPFVVASTLGLFASGVALLFVGPGGGIVLGLHKASFLVWFVALSAHVLAYVRRVPQLIRADFGDAARKSRKSGVAFRRFVVAAAMVAGMTLAIATLPLARPWLHWNRSDREDIRAPVPRVAAFNVIPAEPSDPPDAARRTRDGMRLAPLPRVGNDLGRPVQCRDFGAFRDRSGI